jgi:hypothetical protein
MLHFLLLYAGYGRDCEGGVRKGSISGGIREKRVTRFEPLFLSHRRNVAEAILTVGGFLHNWQVQGFHNIPKQGMSGSLSVSWVARSGIQASRSGCQVSAIG